ncbi:MAG: GGDEF domain-containing protein [Eubacteriales bacterium]
MDIKNIPFVLIALLMGIIGIIADYFMDDELQILLWFIRILVYVFIGLWLKRFVNIMYANVYKDALTGLNNRVYLYFYLEQKLNAIGRTHKPISLAVIDIDDFKNINDSYGHLEGDRALVQVSKLIVRCIRQNDFVVRWGGEEFIVVLEDADRESAFIIADRIRHQIEQKSFEHKDHQYKITVSIGLETTNTKMSANDLIYAADKLLYKAKEEKNIVLN